jgi:hypothetical protein
MSENPMDGFGSPGLGQPEEAPSSGRNPKVLIGGGIGLAVLAVLGGYLLLGGSGGGSSTPTAATGVHHPVPTTTPPTVISVGKPTPAVRTFNGDVGRDPFAALITSPPAPTTKAPKPTATPTTSVSVSPTVSPTLPGQVVGPPPVVTLPPVQTSTPVPTTTAPSSVLVVLKAIEFPTAAAPAVLVTYSGHSYVLKTGQSAGGSLKVVAIAPDDGTATFQLGDQTFDLHIGQSFVD